MRLSICTLAAILVANTIAAPTSKVDNPARSTEELEGGIAKRGGGDNKYFHEPGYVLGDLEHLLIG